MTKETRERFRKRIRVFFGVLLFCVLAVLLFTGKVRVKVEQDSLQIEASYWPGKEVPYDEVLSVGFREELEKGRRTGGFGSFRLGLGTFRNEAFGSYIRYAYESCDACVILETEDRMIVVNQKSPEQTRKLYEEIEEAWKGFAEDRQ